MVCLLAAYCSLSPCSHPHIVFLYCKQQEFKQAIWLCYIAAGCAGVLPPFWGRRPNKLEWRIRDHDATADRIPTFLKLVVLTVPVSCVFGVVGLLLGSRAAR